MINQGNFVCKVETVMEIQVLSAEASKDLIFLMMCSDLPTCSCHFEFVITMSMPDLYSVDACPLSKSP